MLQHLIDPVLRLAVACPADYQRLLSPAGERLVAGAVAKRRAEFRAGRHCAGRVLAQLGMRAELVGIGPQRQPLWPQGVVGSITHCQGYCAAVAGLEKDVSAVGIDVEENTPLDPDLMELVCTAEERLWLEQTPWNGEARRWGKLLFCIKEAVYKAYFPRHGTFVDFQQATVTLNPGGQGFQTQLRLGPDGRMLEYRGRYAGDERFWYSCVTVAQT